MDTEIKDVPLLLRRRRDGVIYLDTRFCDDFPPRHEFSKEWLLENTMTGVVQMTPERIKLVLGNGTATYTIDRSLMEVEVEVQTQEEADYYELEIGDTRTARLSTGYWGILAESEVDHG